MGGQVITETRKRVDAVAEAYADMNQKERAAFRIAIAADSRYKAVDIAESMRAMGYNIDSRQVTYYRLKIREGKIKLESD